MTKRKTNPTTNPGPTQKPFKRVPRKPKPTQPLPAPPAVPVDPTGAPLYPNYVPLVPGQVPPGTPPVVPATGVPAPLEVPREGHSSRNDTPKKGQVIRGSPNQSSRGFSQLAAVGV